MKPTNCAWCDSRAIVGDVYKGFRVACADPFCWIGPKRPSVQEAVESWNTAMELFHAAIQIGAALKEESTDAGVITEEG